MPEAVIVDAIRTPIGRAGKGSLKSVRADDLAAIPLRALIERNPELDQRSNAITQERPPIRVSQTRVFYGRGGDSKLGPLWRRRVQRSFVGQKAPSSG